MNKKIIFSLLTAFISVSSFSQTVINAKDAAKHLNEKVMITEKVFGGRFFSNSGTTLLDVGGSHPNELVTLIVKGDDRKKFATAPEEAFRDKTITVTGTLIDYKGKPEIVITDPGQIKIN